MEFYPQRFEVTPDDRSVFLQLNTKKGAGGYSLVKIVGYAFEDSDAELPKFHVERSAAGNTLHWDIPITSEIGVVLRASSELGQTQAVIRIGPPVVAALGKDNEGRPVPEPGMSIADGPFTVEGLMTKGLTREEAIAAITAKMGVPKSGDDTDTPPAARNLEDE